MLKVIIPAQEKWDEEHNRFIELKEAYTLELEHSLRSIAAWEQKTHKIFLSEDEKTFDETIDYIKCMTLNDVPNYVYDFIPDSVILDVEAYMSDAATATKFYSYGTGEERDFRKQITTSETIYYWMIESGIPIEFENWHFNRLITMIRYVNSKRAAKESKGKPLTAQALANRDRLNAARRKAMHSRG